MFYLEAYIKLINWFKSVPLRMSTHQTNQNFKTTKNWLKFWY